MTKEQKKTTDIVAEEGVLYLSTNMILNVYLTEAIVELF